MFGLSGDLCFFCDIDQGPGSDVLSQLTFQLGKRQSFVDFPKAPERKREKSSKPLTLQGLSCML